MTTIAERDAEAREILIANDRGGYSVPTHGLYPYQWNWDSAFAAFGYAQFDLDRAWQEFETLVSGQWPDGWPVTSGRDLENHTAAQPSGDGIGVSLCLHDRLE